MFRIYPHSHCRIYTSGDNMYESFTAAHEAVKEEYYDVYSSSSKLEAVVSMLLCNGAQFVLDGDNDTACLYASLACYFEEWISEKVLKSKAFFSWVKVCELDVADDHTLLQCLRRRIPCGCLNKKYEEVKSVKKMGCCFNPSCSLPEGKVERSKMFYCTRCCNANYCSIECQKADWKRHRVDCDIIVGRKAEFDSAKRQGQGKRGIPHAVISIQKVQMNQTLNCELNKLFNLARRRTCGRE
eukprot:scaffold2139_cov79-Skeletonema_dohrnii-CCMP3373.AAC.9